MHHLLHEEEAARPPTVSTGHLPDAGSVAALVTEGYERYRHTTDGEVANYIPALAAADRAWFGVAICGVDGRLVTAGDADRLFSIQSISKPFVFALVCQALGGGRARASIGVNATGLPFNSVMAIELNQHRTMNPMVNAGAIATTSLAPGANEEERWQFVRDGLSRFAGRELAMDEPVYASEAATNERNRGIARLLHGYGRMYSDPDEATNIYTRQCSLLVSAQDLAVMGATLADGGTNPLTKQRVLDPDRCKRVLAVMATAGLYEQSGDWLYEVGLPGKSGVSGGLVTIAPGKGGLGTFAPPLDDAGNSVRGQLVTQFLSDRLGLNLFASKPEP
jgi:glutaminase